MNSNKTKSFEEFLSLRKFSSSNNQIPENLPASASLLKIIPYENPEKYHSIEKKHKNADLNLKKKNISKNTKKENKVHTAVLQKWGVNSLRKGIKTNWTVCKLQVHTKSTNKLSHSALNSER